MPWSRQLLLLVGAAGLIIDVAGQKSGASDDGVDCGGSRTEIVAAADLRRHRDDLREVVRVISGWPATN